jgi:site-specific DNA-methyltransferase (adenine-specific)
VTRWRVEQGDCLDRLRALPDASVDSVVTDPPYGLAFMGKRWDYDVPSVEVWAECLRVLKPGGHLLAFAGTRTQHRMAVRIEDAGFDIRDMIAWVYGSGFPKSLDVSKAIDKAAGAERVVVGQEKNWGATTAADGKTAYGDYAGGWSVTAPATDAARQWQGWGTALKPALEPITVARKPLAGTVAANVLAHGTGGMNVEGCRIGTTKSIPASPAKANDSIGTFKTKDRHTHSSGFDASVGRWPANFIHDGSTEATNLLGDAARFFYTAKTSKAERGDENHHPTVKPIDLMRYLCRLVTPPDGLVLDPFTGSGSTGCAALLEGFRFHGIEREPEYVAIATARIAHWARQADAVQVAMPL